MAKILIVEDEESIAHILKYNLEAVGHNVHVIHDGEEASLYLREIIPDLLILDWMLPHLSGIELCRRLRQRESTVNLPIMMLTARTDESEKIRGFDVGADDYITKPYSLPELMARVKALLRRSNSALIQEIIQIQDLKLDRGKQKAWILNQEVEFASTEFRLLEHLVLANGKVLSREKLILEVWENEADIDERTVDVHIGRLRKILRRYDAEHYIRTVRGTGYAIETEFN